MISATLVLFGFFNDVAAQPLPLESITETPTEDRRLFHEEMLKPGVVCFVNFGDDYGELAVVITYLDPLVVFDFPYKEEGMQRNTLSKNRLSPTDFTMKDVKPTTTSAELTKLADAQKIRNEKKV